MRNSKVSLALLLMITSRAFAMPCATGLTSSSADYARMVEILDASPDANGYELQHPLRKEFHELIAPYLPVSARGRVALLTREYGTSVAARMNLGHANTEFAFELIRYLSLAMLLRAKTADGVYQLPNALITPPAPVTVPFDRDELDALLSDPATTKFPLDGTKASVRRLHEVAAARVPADPDARATTVAAVFGPRFAITVDYEDSNENFATNLLHWLSAAARLAEKDENGA